MTDDIRRGAPDMVQVLRVIEVTVLRGAGTDSDPARLVKQYWLHEQGASQLLAERDDWGSVERLKHQVSDD